MSRNEMEPRNVGDATIARCRKDLCIIKIYITSISFI